MCKEIERLIDKRQGFGAAFTVYKKAVDRGFYLSVSVNDADFERVNFNELKKVKKESAVLSINSIYDNNHDVSQEEKDDIFKRGEMGVRLRNALAGVPQ